MRCHAGVGDVVHNIEDEVLVGGGVDTRLVQEDVYGAVPEDTVQVHGVDAGAANHETGRGRRGAAPTPG